MNRQLRYNNNIANPIIFNSINPLINPLYWFGESGVQYVLDMYSESELGASYALRTLNTNYTGSCIRIRREADNAEQDIGFNGNDLDINGLSNFIGGYGCSTVACFNAKYPTFASASLVNLASNGDFALDSNSDGLANNWVDNATSTIFSLVSNTQKFTPTVQYGGINQFIPTVTNKIYFLRAKVKASSSNVVLRYQGGTFPTVNHSGSGNFETLSLLFTAVSTSSNIRIYNGAASGFSEVEIQEVTCIPIDSAYVTTWYDQSSNSNHLTQSTAANQPRIVNAGILDRDFDTVKAGVLWPDFASASGVNGISNGDMSNGTTGYTPSNCILTASSNTLFCTGTGIAPYTVQSSTGTKPTLAGSRFLVKCKFVQRTNTCIKVDLRVKVGVNSTTLATINNPVQDQQYILAGVGNLQYYGSNAEIFFVSYYSGSSSGIVTEIQELTVIDVSNYGTPCLTFNGSTQCLINTANQASINIITQPLYLNSVFSTDSAISASGNVLCKNLDSNSNIQYSLLYENAVAPAKSLWNYLENTARAKGTENSVVAGIQQIGSSMWNTGTSTILKNGVVDGTTASYSSNLTSRTNLHIGCRGNTSNTQTQFLKGKISEIHITKITDQAALIADQKTYYGIA